MRRLGPLDERAPRGNAPVLFLGFGVVAGLLIAVVFGLVRYLQPIPALSAASTYPAQIRVAAPADPFPWPSQGQAAIYVDGLGVVATHNLSNSPVPIASTTKMMTALLILEHHPLTATAQGPTLTLTQADVTAYQQGVAQDQSVVEVQAGETITERQLLEGLLLPSGNNFAQILAAWDAGSEKAFIAQMNAKAAALAMRHTHFADTSGFAPQTVSTPLDLLTLARAAMANPVFAAIVKQRSTTLPVVGTVKNYNELLGKDGVIGIKTGSTDQAGGCLVFAFDLQDSAGTHRVYGVVLGQKDLASVFPVSRAIVEAVPTWLRTTTVVTQGQVVGTYTAPWGGTVTAVAARTLDMTTWDARTITTKVTLDPIHAPVGETTKVGVLTATAGGRTESVDLVTGGGLEGPGFGWRLSHG